MQGKPCKTALTGLGFIYQLAKVRKRPYLAAVDLLVKLPVDFVGDVLPLLENFKVVTHRPYPDHINCFLADPRGLFALLRAGAFAANLPDRALFYRPAP